MGAGESGRVIGPGGADRIAFLASDGESGEVETTELGARLRTLRQERKKTLDEVAAATGVSRSFLSLVENGRSDLTTGRLIELVRYYGISITDLVPDEAFATTANGDILVARASECQHIESRSEGMDVALLLPTTGRSLMLVQIDFAPGAHMTEPAHHAGEEIVHVLSGAVAIELDGGEPVELRVGDSISYAATTPHAYFNVAEGPSRALVIVTPPSY